MAEATVTLSPGKMYGQEYLGRGVNVYDLTFTTLQTVNWSLATSGVHATPTATPEEPAFRLVSGDAGSTGGLGSGISTYLSDGTSVGRLYTWGTARPLSTGTATLAARTAGAEREQKLLGCAMRVFDFASVADTNTYTSGLTSGIVDFCYQASTKAVNVTESAGVFTFSVTSGPATNVRLIVWMKV